jgi:hypothetical protein
MVAPSSVHWHPSRALVVDALVPDRSRINRCTRKQAKHQIWFACGTARLHMHVSVWWNFASSCRQNVLEKPRSGLAGLPRTAQPQLRERLSHHIFYGPSMQNSVPPTWHRCENDLSGVSRRRPPTGCDDPAAGVTFYRLITPMNRKGDTGEHFKCRQSRSRGTPTTS